MNEGIKMYFFNVSVYNHRLVKQDRQFNEYDGPLEYLVMGHSRPARAVDATSIDGCYSYCTSGENNVRSYYKLVDVLENHHSRIRTILLPIGISSVSLDNPTRMKNGFYWSSYLDYFELAELTGDHSTYWKMYLKSKLFPYYEYPYMRLMQRYKDMRIIIPDSVYATATEKERVSFAHEIIENQKRFASINDPVSQQYVQKTIDLVQSHRKELIFVKYPVSKYYLDAIKEFQPKWLISQQQIECIISNQKNVYFFDFETIFLDHPEYFRDTHHLNEKGRAVFTKILDEKLKRLN
ncbi:MAG: hypothetical protein ACJAUD_000138 [Crocinitomicaceae bacterium]|jgi:hypothetical protein